MHTTTIQESHSLISSDRVEGTPVCGADGTKIGTVERVMIDKITGSVAYAVLSFHGSGMGQKRLPIPWARLTYDRKLGAYHLDLTEGGLSDARFHVSDKNFDLGDRDREIESQECYREKRYWGIAEGW